MGYFFVRGPLGNLKSFSGDVRRHIDSIASFSPGLLVKNDQILKLVYFTCLCT